MKNIPMATVKTMTSIISINWLSETMRIIQMVSMDRPGYMMRIDTRTILILGLKMVTDPSTTTEEKMILVKSILDTMDEIAHDYTRFQSGREVDDTGDVLG